MYIKICCISSEKEAQLAIDYGADAIGLVGPMPNGPGIITNDQIQKIAKMASSKVDTFLLTSETSVKGIIEHYKKVKTNTIQLVDELQEGSYEELTEALPNVKLVQVIHVFEQAMINHALRISEKVDALLLDSGNPNAKIKTLGGTGETHNWDWSKEICKQSKIPVYLAGGLDANNVQNAIQKVNPSGVDLCSGVRSNGLLDEDKLKAYMMAVRDLND